MTYHPSKLTVNELLGAFYRVPEFQRKYAWGRQQISDLVNDIFGDSGWQPDTPYFLGSIVTVRAPEEATKPFLLIDGQQRLTTLSLIIRVLLNRVEKETELEIATKGAFLIQNQDKLFELRPTSKGSSEKRYRLNLQPTDAQIFERIVADSEAKYDTETAAHAVCKAAFVIDEEISRAVSTTKQLLSSRHPYYDMLYNLTTNVEVVRINADSESDAFRLFEALNDRGLRLSAADLVKNKLLAKTAKGDTKKVLESWERILELVRDDIIAFLRASWIACEDFVRKADLYSSYKRKIDSSSSKDVARFAEALLANAETYREILKPTPAGRKGLHRDLHQAMQRLIEFGAKTCRPAILSVRMNHKQNLKLQLEVVRLCESITVRYSLVGGNNPNLLERLYADMAAKLRDPACTLEVLAGIPEMSQIPNDQEFRGTFAGLRVGKGGKAWHAILECLNSELAGSKIELDTRSISGIHIEHILPQRLSAATAATYGFQDVESAQICAGLVGNLTLLGETKNKRASNAPFKEKRKVYADSDIHMTRSLAPLKSWSQSNIRQRGKDLADAAVRQFRLFP